MPKATSLASYSNRSVQRPDAGTSTHCQPPASPLFRKVGRISSSTVRLSVEADPSGLPLRVGELRHDHPGGFDGLTEMVHSSGRADSDASGWAPSRMARISAGIARPVVEHAWLEELA